MNIIEAVNLMKQGKKLRPVNFIDDTYMLNETILYLFDNLRDPERYLNKEFLACEWELVEEDDPHQSDKHTLCPHCHHDLSEKIFLSIPIRKSGEHPYLCIHCDKCNSILRIDKSGITTEIPKENGEIQSKRHTICPYCENSLSKKINASIKSMNALLQSKNEINPCFYINCDYCYSRLRIDNSGITTEIPKENDKSTKDTLMDIYDFLGRIDRTTEYIYRQVEILRDRSDDKEKDNATHISQHSNEILTDISNQIMGIKK